MHLNQKKIGDIFLVVMAIVIIVTGGYVVILKRSQPPRPSSPSPISSSQPFTAQNKTDVPLRTQDVSIPDVKNEVFIATRSVGVLHVVIFNPVTQNVVTSKDIPLNDFLAPSSTNSLGANDSIQYNSKTKDIFFSTHGESFFDGSCANSDGTCLSRLYKMSLDQTKPTLFFESENPPTNWMVNHFDNSLLLSFVEEQTQTILKIDGQDGKTIFTKQHQLKANTGLADFVLSKDGTYIYQASKESVNASWTHEILRLRKMNLTNGDVEETDIFAGESIDYETDLSPDNNHLAFYSGAQQPTKLHIYEIPTKKRVTVPYQGSVNNYNLIWSGDSKKLLHLLNNSLTSYDIVSEKSAIIYGDPRQTRYVYAWAPSVQYFTYLSPEGDIKIFDVEKGMVIDPGIKKDKGVEAVYWY